jgi:hypothetical protein
VFFFFPERMQEEYREKVLEENWHVEEDLFSRQNPNIDFYFLD